MEDYDQSKPLGGLIDLLLSGSPSPERETSLMHLSRPFEPQCQSGSVTGCFGRGM